MRHVAPVIIAILFLAPARLSYAAQKQLSLSDPETVVEMCVKIVHMMRVSNIDEPYFRQFDAFYNSATGTVINNAWRNGDIHPLYEFNKCMARIGLPLGEK